MGYEQGNSDDGVTSESNVREPGPGLVPSHILQQWPLSGTLLQIEIQSGGFLVGPPFVDEARRAYYLKIMARCGLVWCLEIPRKV